MEKYNWETKIIEELAEKYKLPKRLVSQIAHSPYEFLKKEISKEDKSIILTYLGKIAVSKGKKKYWDDKKELEETNSNTESIQGNVGEVNTTEGEDSKAEDENMQSL